MTLARRILARLDTDGTRVLQRAGFPGPADAGDPAELAGRYAEEGADELAVFAAAAARQHPTNFLGAVRRLAAQVRIPLAAGGGIRGLEDARALLRAGADRVIVNSAVLRAPQLLEELADAFGAPAITVAISARRPAPGAPWQAVTSDAGEPLTRDAVEWAAQASERGAGEILLHSLERDGAREGFDCELSAAVCAAVSVAVVASGGASTSDDFLAVFTEGRADAAMAATAFHEATLSIRTLKQYLDSRGLRVRT